VKLVITDYAIAQMNTWGIELSRRVRMILPGFATLLALNAMAQDPGPKLLKQDYLDSTDLAQLGAFDTLATWIQKNEASVDTTVVLSDTLLFSIVMLGRTDGTGSLIYLMSYDRVKAHAIDLVHLCDQADIEPSLSQYTWAEHSVWTSGEVCVMEYDCHVQHPGKLDEETTMVLKRRRFWNVLWDGRIQGGGWEEVER
jgi:hypothetical protein